MSRVLIFVCTLILMSAALAEENPKDQSRGTNSNHHGNPIHSSNPNNMNPSIDSNMFPNMDFNIMNPNLKPHEEMPKQHSQQHNHNATKMSETSKVADMQKMPDTKTAEKQENPTNGRN